MKFPALPLSVSASLLLLSAVETPAAGPDWPQFRGPEGNGHASAANVSLPETFSETENVAWKTPLPGKGWSSPVIGNGKIWVTTAIEVFPTDEEAEELLAESNVDPKHFKARQVAKEIKLQALELDFATGAVLRTIDLFTIEKPDPIHKFNSYASPTPVLEDGRLYCHFGTFGTVCLDTKSGAPVWTRAIPLEHAVGPGSSPFITGDRLILICDGVDAQYVLALDKNTGQDLWKTDRPPMRADDGDRRKSYNTPVAITGEDGREQLICMGSQWLVSYDPATGREIWRLDHGDGFSVVPRPVIGHGMVYISTGFGKPELWAIRTDGEGDVTQTHVAWKEPKRIPAKPSPILVGDELYVISDGGIASCFDAQTGALHWTDRIEGNYSASPLYAGGNIHFFSEEGRATTLAPGKSFTPTATNHLDGAFMATPAALDSTFILRTDQALYRIEKR